MSKMNALSGGPSAFTKMRQVYWEAKHSFNKTLGQREDNYIISSDSDLDTRLELLQAADNSFNALLKIILKYRNTLQDFVDIQESFGLTLIGYGTKDSTAAGKVMCMSGKAISKAAQRQIKLKTYLRNLFLEIQTFQFIATADALQTVTKMEKVRKSYRSGLMWLKNESMELDPDVGKKLRNFRKVQEHIKRLKVKFDGVKLESLQKIDLFLLSRSNLFSRTLDSYSETFEKICKRTENSLNYTLMNIPSCLSYNFVTLKELNQYSKLLQHASQRNQLEPMSKKQKKKSRAKTSGSTFTVTDASGKPYSALELLSILKGIKCETSKSEDIKNDELNLLQTNNSSGDASLIDLHDDRVYQPLTKLVKGNQSTPTLKYSEDLLSINFDYYRTKYRKELFTDKLEKRLEDSLAESNSRDNSTREVQDLKFWSLIESLDQTSNSTELNNAETNGPDLICPKRNLPTASDSRWDDILVLFDPFLEEMPGRKIKTECSELC